MEIDYNNCEIAFWKVFHNKYLLNKIINYIQTLEWVVYSDYNQIHINNRIKFKDINSLKWMINNNQYELLKYKIKSSDTKEYIKIKESSVRLLFRIGGSYNNEFDEFEEKEEKEENTNKLNEILILLLKYRNKELMKFNLVDIAIKCLNLEIVKLLLSEPYSFQIFPSSLEWAINNLSPKFIEQLINLPNIVISEETRNNSLQLSNSNKDYKNEMNEYIKNNLKLHNPNSTFVPLNNSTNDNNENKKIKFDNGTPPFSATMVPFSPSTVLGNSTTLPITQQPTRHVFNNATIEASNNGVGPLSFITPSPLATTNNSKTTIFTPGINFSSSALPSQAKTTASSLYGFGSFNNNNININKEEANKETITTTSVIDKEMTDVNTLPAGNKPFSFIGPSSSSFTATASTTTSTTVANDKEKEKFDNNKLVEQSKPLSFSVLPSSSSSSSFTAAAASTTTTSTTTAIGLTNKTTSTSYGLASSSTITANNSNFKVGNVFISPKFTTSGFDSSSTSSFLSRLPYENNLPTIFSSYKTNEFKILLSSFEGKEDELNIFRDKIKSLYFKPEPILDDNKETAFEFMLFYTSNSTIENYFQDNNIQKYIFKKSMNQEQYKSLIERIISPNNNRLYECLPKLWNQLLSDIFNNSYFTNLHTWNVDKNQLELNNIETIDWISDNALNNQYFILKLHELKNIGLLKFSSIEIIEYAKKKIPTFFFNTDKELIEIYKPLFFKAIGECNLQVLKSITKTVPIPFNLLNSELRNQLKKQPRDKLVELIQYFNECNYCQFSSSSFIEFLKMIYQHCDATLLSNIKIRITHNFEVESTELFMSSLTRDIEIVKFFINNGFNPIKTLGEISNRTNKSFFEYNFIFEIDEYVDIDDSIIGKLKQSNESFDTIFSSIELLLNRYEVDYLNNCQSSDSIGTPLGITINYLFKILIQTDGIEFKKLKYLYKKINTGFMVNDGSYKLYPFKLGHTIFHSIYYLAIKSPILVKYIMEFPFLTNLLIEARQNTFTDTFNHGNFDNCYNIEHHLNSKVYTFDFIFGNSDSNGLSIDELFDKLINDLTHVPGKKDLLADFYIKALNYTLEFCLEVRQVDTFFKQLDLIQTLLENDEDEFINQEFPYLAHEIEGYNRLSIISNCSDIECNQYNHYLKPIVNERVFYFTKTMVEKASKLMDNQQFNRFIRFNSYYSIISFLIMNDPDEDETLDLETAEQLLNQSSLINHLLINHYKLKNEEVKQEDEEEELDIFDVSEFWLDVIDTCIIESKELEYLFIKYSKLLFSLIPIDKILDRLLDNGGKFNYNIVLSELIKKEFYNNEILVLQERDQKEPLPFFIITKSIINEAIKDKQINYLKFYYENGTINDNDKDQLLLQHLKNELSNHSDYKYINWLKLN